PQGVGRVDDRRREQGLGRGDWRPPRTGAVAPDEHPPWREHCPPFHAATRHLPFSPPPHRRGRRPGGWRRPNPPTTTAPPGPALVPRVLCERRLATGHARANRIRAQRPGPPSRPRSSIAAPCRPAISRARARPSPLPELVAPAPRWNRSSTRSRSSGGIPGPVSSTSAIAASPSVRTRTSTLPPAGVYRIALSTRFPSATRR